MSDDYLAYLAGLVVVLLVASPLLFTQRGFNLDLTNNLWLGNVQRLDAFHGGLFPSYFTNTTGDGIFNPFFAFYGGTMYAIFGNLAFVLGGNVVAAADVLTVGAIMSAYWGLYWLGRQLGLSKWFAQAPSLVFVTSAYYVTDLYGRGDWLEFLAVSSLPMLVASGLDRLLGRRWRFGSAVMFAASVVVFTGSHDITLLWGTMFVCLAAFVVLVLCGTQRVKFRAVSSLAGVGLVATLVNAWALVPNLLYANKTAGTLVRGATASFFEGWSVIFYPLRLVPKLSTTPALFVQAPVFFIVWSLAGAATMLLRKRSRELARPWLAMVVLLAIVTGVMMATPLWFHMPRPLLFIQFAYRLSTYVALAAGGLTGVVALMTQRQVARSDPPRGAIYMRYLLIAVALFSLSLCVWQLWVPNTAEGPVYADRTGAETPSYELPRSWYEVLQYSDRSAPVVPVQSTRVDFFSPLLVKPGGSNFDAVVAVPPGTAPFLSNIVAGAYLASVGGGVERVGRIAGGYAVLRRVAPGTGPVRVTITTARSTGVQIGQLLSVISTILLLVFLATVAMRSKLAARRSRSTSIAKL